MRSFANALALLLAVAGAARAQLVRPDTSPAVPRPLVRRVTAAIASQWGDDTAALALVWGRIPPEATFPPATDVRLVGQGDGGWFVAVFTPGPRGPFAVRVRAGARDSTVVAARTMEAGRTLAPEDLRVVPRTRWGPPADAGIHVTAGWVTRHVIMAGSEVTSNSVAPPPIVHVGDPVRLEWRRGAVLITLDGTALDAGAVGQTVHVRVGQDRGARTGTVLATGTVRLDS